MWYDKRWMRLSFYVGVMFTATGLGIAYMDDSYRLTGAILMCIGAALIVYGFMGIMINNMVEEQFRRKKRRRPSSQER